MKIQKRKRKHAASKKENDVEAISHFPFPNPRAAAPFPSAGPPRAPCAPGSHVTERAHLTSIRGGFSESRGL